MSEQREQLRSMVQAAWQKRNNKDDASPLELQIIELVSEHPEYQKLIEDPKMSTEDFDSKENPFLHLSLHLGLLEQVATNRPAGIREIYQKAIVKFGGSHPAEHEMMRVLGSMLMQAQQSGSLPGEEVYLAELRKLVVTV